MASYLQFLNGHRRGERKRAYWICGPERRLVEEVVDMAVEQIAADDFSSTTMFVSEARDRDVWAQLDVMPTGDDRRLVIVREAEQLVNWEPLADWWDEPALRPVHAIFVSNEDNTDTSKSHMRLFVSRGKFVRCGPFHDPTPGSKDQRIDVFRSHAPIGIGAARLLLARTRGRMGPALDVLAKCRLMTDAEIDERYVKALAASYPDEDFTEALVSFRATDAFSAARAVPTEEYGSVIAKLDYELGTLARLHRAMTKMTGPRVADRVHKLATISGVEPVAVVRLGPYARRYDRTRVRTCIQALAMADSRVAGGETDLVLEVLTSLWMTVLS